MPLFEKVLDYAGTFPPASWTLGDAFAEYARIKAGGDAWMLGRFVVSAARLGDFERIATCATEWPDGRRWALSVLMPADATAERVSAIDAFNARWRERFRIEALEFSSGPLAALTAAAGAVPQGIEVFCETPLDDELDARLHTIKALGAAAKVRTGGVDARAIPSAEALAAFLTSARDAGVAFKATAGLHHALRAEYPLTYDADSDLATMHGFLNVIAAADALWTGGSARDALHILLEFSPDQFAIRSADPRGFRKRFFRSFASCDYREPVADLRRLGLL